ncbi:hypothetical protein Tco_0072948 [Tanacetum coccineum]
MDLLGEILTYFKEDGSKYRLKFMLDGKELTLTLDDYRTIFHLPQAIDNNHDRFVHALKFSEMVPFYINDLGFTLELRSLSNFKTTGLIMQMIFTKLIVSHYITAFPEILRRARDKYHNLEDDEMLTENYHMHAVVFGVDVPATQLRIPQRRSTRLTPPTPIPTTNEADDIILQDTIQLSLVEQKSREELEAKQNEDKFKEHLMAEEIKKLVEGTENVEENEVDSSTLRQNDNQNDLDTILKPMSNKESLEVEITAVVQLVYVNKEEEESAEDDYELRRREKGSM